MDLSKEEGTRKVEIGTKDDPENKVIELGEYKETSYEEVSNNSPRDSNDTNGNLDEEEVQVVFVLSPFMQFLTKLFCYNGYRYATLLTILFEIVGIVCYVKALEGCSLTQARCLLFLSNHALKKIVLLVLTSSVSYCTLIILTFKKIIYFLYLIVITIIYTIIVYNNFGANIDDHGSYNFIGFVALCMVTFIVYSIIECFYRLKKKKKYKLIGGIIGSILISLFLFYFLKLRHSCDHFYDGLGGKSLINDPELNECMFPKPRYCLINMLDGLQDVSKMIFRDCHIPNPNERAFLKYFIQDNIVPADNIAYPSTTEYSLYEQENVFLFNKDMIDNLIDVDKEEPKRHHEVVLHFDKNHIGSITIDVKRNETLVKERRAIREKKKNKFLYKNILFIYFDAFSRNHFLRKMKEVKKFIEQYLYDSTKENNKDKVSFQFFKYHTFSFWTHITVAPMFYGESMSNANGTNLVKYFKENGYITGMTEDYCSKELFDVERGDYTQNRTWVNWDHENVAMFCDPNYHNRFVSFPTWKGPYSALRRCLYGKDNFEYALEYTEKFWEAYIDEPKFFRLAFIDAHEGSMEVVKYIDKPLKQMLDRFLSKGWFDETAIYFVSDHGTNMVGLNSLISPDFHKELVLGTFFLVLPNSKDKDMQRQFKNIETNSQRFISPFDIHDTLLYMLYYNQDNTKKSYSKKGQTVYEEINSKHRGCFTYKDFRRGICICQ